ncbi:enoyl-CoA hydratase/isomerase family protein [Amycolatopsis acidicola]|uniref:Enoyl-CoA hydratase/isomerase family protein n=1 Tax=Amycolatopsis acidicola TaxID=2596893 RepID=A0A5N0VCE4_9PSEU|nr:enoyl-CoA hydratase/isomerase family protein [Amycolatopsis acidicola]KAA9164056.1 enoyl-CoA hydratase/isomerase family protein [Amycolatopsis acidicola]
MSQPPETLVVKSSGGICEITLNRPDLRNRIDDLARAELIDALETHGGARETRVIVLAAEGRAFSAGGDFTMMRSRQADRRDTERGTHDSRRLLNALTNVPVPVVAAVQGHAVGLGATIVLACDAVVAARGVKIMDSHVKVGLVAGDGGVVVWPQSIGMIKAKRHLLTGAPVLAEEGYALGMVSDLVDTAEEVLPAARAVAAEIAALPPLAVRGTKKSFNAVLRHRIEEVLELSLLFEGESMHSEDLVKALDFIQHGKEPDYQGK